MLFIVYVCTSTLTNYFTVLTNYNFINITSKYVQFALFRQSFHSVSARQRCINTCALRVLHIITIFARQKLSYYAYYTYAAVYTFCALLNTPLPPATSANLKLSNKPHTICTALTTFLLVAFAYFCSFKNVQKYTTNHPPYLYRPPPWLHLVHNVLYCSYKFCSSSTVLGTGSAKFIRTTYFLKLLYKWTTLYIPCLCKRVHKLKQKLI